MTHVYFVRHSEPNYETHDDRSRELTEKGLSDRGAVTDYFLGKPIAAVLSSPYRRAYDTVKPLADALGLPVETVEDFRERRVDSVWIDDFNAFARRQWADFDYRLSDGECLQEVQTRNLNALRGVLRRFPEHSIAVGAHGTAVCTLIRHYCPSFGYEDFRKIQPVMPLIVHFVFDGETCVSISLCDPLNRPDFTLPRILYR